MIFRPTAIALSAAVLAVGCGDLGGDQGKPTTVVVRQRVSHEQVARYADDGPARVVMEWFRAIGTGDVATAANLYTESAGVEPVEIARQRRRAGETLFFIPHVADVDERGDRATVLIESVRRTRAPNGSERGEQVGGEFTLRRSDGRWRLADNNFLSFTAGSAR